MMANYLMSKNKNHCTFHLAIFLKHFFKFYIVIQMMIVSYAS